MSTLDIQVAATMEEARKMGGLAMDEFPSAGNSYDNWHGNRRADPRFTVVGDPTEDATLAIASLAGILPYSGHDNYDGQNEITRTRDIVSLVSRLAAGESIDLLVEGEAGTIVLAWRARRVKWIALTHMTPSERWIAQTKDWKAFLCRDMFSGHIVHELRWVRENEITRRGAAVAWNTTPPSFVS
jgi:hypothetical protein